MTPRPTTTTRTTNPWPVAALLLAACADEGTDTPTAFQDWATEAEYEIGDQNQGDALFGPYVDVRPAADGSRVYVLDTQASEVTIWTPGGSLLLRVGRAGGGPGEFETPTGLNVLDRSFYVKDNRRITTFTLEGEVIGTRTHPRGVMSSGFPVQIWDMFEDGSYAALELPAVLDASSTKEQIGVLRVVQDGGSWHAEELAQLDFRDWQASVEVDGVSQPLRQPWVTPDHFEVDHQSESVVVKRATSANPGLVELIEISMAGDTLWTRRIQLPAIPVTEEQIEAEVEDWASVMADNPSPMLKSRIRAAWHIPEYWPAVRQIHLMSNGEIWFAALGSDVPGLWYAVRKGADEGPIRRITVPESFQPRDVNATHVWGIRYDELDVSYVVGLRLLPGQQQEPQ